MLDATKIRRVAACLTEAQNILSQGPMEFYLTEMAACYDLLMTRFSPFHAGDRVALVKAPDMDLSPGWHHCRHFLVAGAEGKVEEAKCGSKGFVYTVSFDNDSFVDDKGVVHPRPHAYGFMFRESSLRKLP